MAMGWEWLRRQGVIRTSFCPLVLSLQKEVRADPRPERCMMHCHHVKLSGPCVIMHMKAQCEAHA